MWLSVDPLAADYPSQSPYNYALNNPILYFDPDGKAVFKDSSGAILHDDEQDNGAEVITSQEVVNEYTDDDGNVDWDGVRNDDGSDYNILDRSKYVSWATIKMQEALANNDGTVHRVRFDNRGNIIVTHRPSILGMMLDALFAIGGITAGYKVVKYFKYGKEIIGKECPNCATW